MARYIRYVVHQKIPGCKRQAGLFTAAYHLLREERLSRSDEKSLRDLLAWFQTELPVPPQGLIPERATFWYIDAGPFALRMWDMARLLDDYGYQTERVTTRRVGRVVYQDRYQFAALATKNRRR